MSQDNYSRDNAGGVKRYPVCEAGRWGYIDDRGQIAIPMQFLAADVFSEGLADVTLVHEHNEHGIRAFIDASGDIVIGPGPPQDGYRGYESWRRSSSAGRRSWWTWSDFHDGLARFYDDKACRWGYMDATGKLTIRPQYTDSSDFSEGLALVSDDENRNVPEFMIDKAGRELWRLPRLIVNLGPFREGLARLKTRPQDEIQEGFVDFSGNVAIPLRYPIANEFSESLALCNDGRKWGYIDKNGQVAIPFVFDQALSFTEGAALVVQQNRAKLIDRQGKELCDVPGNFEHVELVDSRDGMFRIARERPDADENDDQTNEWGAIDRSGRLAVAPEFDELEEFDGGVAHAKKGKFCGYVNRVGEFIWKTDQWDD